MEQNKFSIKHWAEDDKPREKLMLKGKSALSDAELLAILIGSGSRDESAVQLCKRILAGVDNNLNLIGKISVKEGKPFNDLMLAREDGTFEKFSSSTKLKLIASRNFKHKQKAIISENRTAPFKHAHNTFLFLTFLSN